MLRHILYATFLTLILSVIIALPLVKVPISASARGVVRPLEENTQLTAVVSGRLIYTSLIRNNQPITQGDTLAIITTKQLDIQKELQSSLLSGYQAQYADLENLLNGSYHSLRTGQYQKELSAMNEKITQIQSELALSHLFTIILIWVGSGYVIDRTITPGELLSFYALIGYFTGPVSELIGMNKSVQNALIAADRLFEIMDLEREETTDKIELLPQNIGDIRFQQISFRYGTRVKVFEDFTCTFERGKTTAIIGESGSGKTTISSLIQNLYPLNGGKIWIGSYDIAYVSNRSLRSIISVVPQQIDLFSGNVIDNIAFGEEFPDIQRVFDIAGELGITDFIEKLPGGFQAYLGENGTLLSGGQKQRIAIARALYRNPEILILDEATSSLDTESELMVRKMIRKFAQ